ncbi:MAG: EF-hand domain-containing protein [Pseudomonadota bacterium]
MKIINTLTLASYLMLSATAAYAAETACDEHPAPQARASGTAITFNAVDGNGDGAITKAEFDAFNARHFDGLDANRDGQITPQEMMGDHSASASNNTGTTHLDRRFFAADGDHNGGLDKQEAQHMPMLEKYFSEVDADKNGLVTRQEYFNAMPLLHGAKNIPTHENPNEM